MEYTVRLDARPESARLALTLRPIDGRAEVVVNGRVVEDLARYAGRRAQGPIRVSVPLPADDLKAGDNAVQLRVREEAGRRGSCVVAEVVLELPR